MKKRILILMGLALYAMAGFVPLASSAPNWGQVQCGNTATLIYPGGPYLSFIVQNQTPNNAVYLGPGSVLTATTGPVYNLVVNAGGSGYTTANGLSVTGGTGTAATVNITALAGVIQTVTINAIGSGYTLGDILTIVQGGGSAGTAKVVGLSNSGGILLSSATGVAYVSNNGAEQWYCITSSGTATVGYTVRK